jgi:hypothetical protein
VVAHSVLSDGKLKSIPAFLAIVNGNAQPLFVSSDTMKVAQWIKGGFKA